MLVPTLFWVLYFQVKAVNTTYYMFDYEECVGAPINSW
jgi:hypothetical protein